jgi:hypothetical protein
MRFELREALATLDLLPDRREHALHDTVRGASTRSSLFIASTTKRRSPRPASPRC